MNTSKVASTLVIAALLSAGFAANAQPPQQQQQQPQGQAPQGQPGAQAPAEPVSEEKVEKFAETFSSVRSIQEEYSAKLQQADDRETAQELQQEAQGEMLEAVESEGLSAQEYNQLVARMDQDPELRERVLSIVGEG